MMIANGNMCDRNLRVNVQAGRAGGDRMVAYVPLDKKLCPAPTSRRRRALPRRKIRAVLWQHVIVAYFGEKASNVALIYCSFPICLPALPFTDLYERDGGVIQIKFYDGKIYNLGTFYWRLMMIVYKLHRRICMSIDDMPHIREFLRWQFALMLLLRLLRALLAGNAVMMVYVVCMNADARCKIVCHYRLHARHSGVCIFTHALVPRRYVIYIPTSLELGIDFQQCNDWLLSTPFTYLPPPRDTTFSREGIFYLLYIYPCCYDDTTCITLR